MLIFLKVWKGFAQRKKTKKMRDEELIFIGMVSKIILLVCALDLCQLIISNHFPQVPTTVEEKEKTPNPMHLAVKTEVSRFA